MDLGQSGETVNTILFIFHNTLSERHLKLSVESLLERQTIKVVWDKVIIHNTHDTITSEQIAKMFVGRVGVVEVLQPQGKKGSLHQDLQTCFTYIKDTVNEGFILVLKGDYALSTNFIEVYQDAVRNMGPMSQWSLPIYNAKESVDDWDILEKLEQPYFRLVDDITYYRCGTNPQHTPEGEVLSTVGKRDTDSETKFVAHNVLPDYNLHVFGFKAAHVVTELYHLMPIEAGWNCVGFMFKGLIEKGVKYYNATRAFGIHTFHATDRGDPRKMIPGQRY